MKIKGVRRSEEERNRIIRGYEKSGQSPREYAKRVGIGLSTLSLWRRKFKTSPGRPRLVEVGSLGSGDFGGGGYRLTLPGGARLEISHGFETEPLKDLLRILREVF